jgi:predicted RNase H-like HicB family nuclease
MTTLAAVKSQLEAAVKASKAEIQTISGKVNGLEASLRDSLVESIKESLSGQTATLQAAMEKTEQAIQLTVNGFRKDITDIVKKISDDVQAVTLKVDRMQTDFDQVKLVAAEASKQAKQAVQTVTKLAATYAQPQPSMIREIKERITNQPNLVLGPISEAIREENLPLHIVQTINFNTDMSLAVADVVAVKRLGREGSQFRGVRVTFANSNVRNKVFNEKRKFGKQRGDRPAVFLNPDLTRSQQEHKRRMLPLFKSIRDTNRQAGIQGKTPFFDEELLYYFPNPEGRMGYPVLHPANYEEHAGAATSPAGIPAARPATTPASAGTSAAAAT